MLPHERKTERGREGEDPESVRAILAPSSTQVLKRCLRSQPKRAAIHRPRCLVISSRRTPLETTSSGCRRSPTATQAKKREEEFAANERRGRKGLGQPPLWGRPHQEMDSYLGRRQRLSAGM